MLRLQGCWQRGEAPGLQTGEILDRAEQRVHAEQVRVDGHWRFGLEHAGRGAGPGSEGHKWKPPYTPYTYTPQVTL